MKRWLVVLAAVSGCKNPAAPPPTPPTPAPTPPAPSGPIDLVATAFGGPAIELPLLAADGSLAAVNASVGFGMSSFSTFEVGLIDASGAEVEHLVVIDKATAQQALQNLAADNNPTVPIATAPLVAAAAKLRARVAGFTPFAAEFDINAIAAAHGTLVLGATALEIVRDDHTGLSLRWLDADAKTTRAETIAVRPREFTDRDGGRCGGVPRLASAWYDEPRHRLLLEIIFPGHDSCEDEQPLWRLW